MIVGIDIVAVAVHLTAVAVAPAVIVTIKRRRIPSARLRRALSRDGHIRTAATKAAETSAGKTVSVVAAAPVGITTYDANGDHRRRRCPRGAATADVTMTMAGERGGEAMATVR